MTAHNPDRAPHHPITCPNVVYTDRNIAALEEAVLRARAFIARRIETRSAIPIAPVPRENNDSPDELRGLCFVDGDASR